MKACAASVNLPRDINQCGLAGAEKRNTKNSRAISPSLHKNNRQLCALPRLSNINVIAAASSIPID